MTKKNPLNRQPIHYACIKGDIKKVNQLMKEKGFKLNVKDIDGFTPIMFACHHGHLNIFNKLLKVKGVNINMRTYNGKTCLMLAAQKGHIKIVNKLLSLGAKTQFKERKRTKRSCRTRTAYNMARMCGHNNIVKKLSKKKMVKMVKRKLSLKKSNNKQKGGSAAAAAPVSTGCKTLEDCWNCMKPNCTDKVIEAVKLALNISDNILKIESIESPAGGSNILISLDETIMSDLGNFFKKIKLNEVMKNFLLAKSGIMDDALNVEHEIVETYNDMIKFTIKSHIGVAAVGKKGILASLTTWVAGVTEISINFEISIPEIQIFNNTEHYGAIDGTLDDLFKETTKIKISLTMGFNLEGIFKIFESVSLSRAVNLGSLLVKTGVVSATKRLYKGAKHLDIEDIKLKIEMFKNIKENLTEEEIIKYVFIIIGLYLNDPSYVKAKNEVEKYDNTKIRKNEYYQEILIELHKNFQGDFNGKQKELYEDIKAGKGGDVVEVPEEEKNNFRVVPMLKLYKLYISCEKEILKKKVEYSVPIDPEEDPEYPKNVVLLKIGEDKELNIKNFIESFNDSMMNDSKGENYAISIYYDTGEDFLKFKDFMPTDISSLYPVFELYKNYTET